MVTDDTNREGGDPHATGARKPPHEPQPAAGAGPAAAPLHDPKKCRSCSAEILWCQVLDERGAVTRRPDGTPKAIPVDFAPVENGNVQVFDRDGAIVARVLSRPEVAALPAGTRLRVSHFATCKQADEWRKAKDAR